MSDQQRPTMKTKLPLHLAMLARAEKAVGITPAERRAYGVRQDNEAQLREDRDNHNAERMASVQPLAKPLRALVELASKPIKKRR